MQEQYRIPVVSHARNFYQQNPGRAIAIGIGAAVLAPTVLPLLKPVAKATIKTGVTLYEKTKGVIAETGEVIGDLVAEAKAEALAEQAQNRGIQQIPSASTSTVDN